FNLAACRWPANAGRNMLNPQFATVHIKSGYFSPSRLKLSSLISKNLLWNAIALNRSIKQQHSILACRIPNLNRPSNEPGAVIKVADHPEIITAKFEISLPQTVAVFSLETLLSPRLSRRCNRAI